jgi:hypothetical protein
MVESTDGLSCGDDQESESNRESLEYVSDGSVGLSYSGNGERETRTGKSSTLTKRCVSMTMERYWKATLTSLRP